MLVQTPELPAAQLREALRVHRGLGAARVVLDSGIARSGFKEIMRLMEQTAAEILGGRAK